MFEVLLTIVAILAVAAGGVRKVLEAAPRGVLGRFLRSMDAQACGALMLLGEGPPGQHFGGAALAEGALAWPASTRRVSRLDGWSGGEFPLR
jgi:hypothetical protein